MGLPALAARALRVLGKGETCYPEQEQLQLPVIARDTSIAFVQMDESNAESDGQQCWQLLAVPQLVKLVGNAGETPKGSSKQSMQALPHVASLGSAQTHREYISFLSISLKQVK